MPTLNKYTVNTLTAAALQWLLVKDVGKALNLRSLHGD